MAPALMSSIALVIASAGVGARFVPFETAKLFAFTQASVSYVISIASGVGRLNMAPRICLYDSDCELVSNCKASSK